MVATIAIINYNYGRFLSTAIESALKQDTKATFEVLLIDDGSTDNSDEIANNYVRYSNFRISKTPNQGFAKSLNRAITEARGKYVFFLDADDYFSINKLSCILPLFGQDVLYISDTSQYIDEVGKKLNSGAFGSTSTVAVKKKAVLPLMPIENEIYLYSLFIIGRGKILSEKYTYYRFHNNNMTNRKEAGKWQTYLGDVTNNLSNTLYKIGSSEDQTVWSASKQNILKAASFFKSRAYYNYLEACLELKQWRSAKENYRLMMKWGFRYKKQITWFHFKTLLKVILMRPSFPKQ